jgi:hypothetical protein
VELTPLLLRQRLSFLFEQVMARSGPVEDIEWELVYCDRCGQVQHLVRDGYPVGWTTTGSFEGGWTDLCQGCSQ